MGSSPQVFISVFLFVLLIAAAIAFDHPSSGFFSAEVRFSDAAKGGLSIVPASCPSNPGDAEDPNGCGGPANIYGLCPDGSVAPSGNPEACGGNFTPGPSPLCPTGYIMQNGECFPGGGQQQPSLTCPTGYTLQNNTCINTSTNCPLGYSLQNNTCVFTSCPGGYAYSAQSNSCVLQQCVDQLVCGADGNLYHEDSSCGESLSQTCSWGCFAGACALAPTPSGNIIVRPSLIKSGNITSVLWSAANVQSCTVSGSNGDGQGWRCTGEACSATSTETSSVINAQTTYTLACTGLDSSTFTRSATVNIVPKFDEQ